MRLAGENGLKFTFQFPPSCHQSRNSIINFCANSFAPCSCYYVNSQHVKFIERIPIAQCSFKIEPLPFFTLNKDADILIKFRANLTFQLRSVFLGYEMVEKVKLKNHVLMTFFDGCQALSLVFAVTQGAVNMKRFDDLIAPPTPAILTGNDIDTYIRI